MYVCWNCGKEFEELEFVRCPYCGAKFLFKKTPMITRTVSTD